MVLLLHPIVVDVPLLNPFIVDVKNLAVLEMHFHCWPNIVSKFCLYACNCCYEL